MEVVLYLAGLAFGVAILVKCADWFTDAAVETARKFRVPEIIVGATIVSLCTTLPEFAVSFTAALKGDVDITIGNAVGSCICNIGLILGLNALLVPIIIKSKGLFSGVLGLLGLTVLFGGLGYIFPQGSYLTGIILVMVLFLYLGMAIKTSLAGRAENAPSSGDECAVHEDMSTQKIVILFMLGAAGVALGSQIMLHFAVKIALLMGISQLVIGLTIVALGTSTPELAVSIAAIIKKKRGLSVGNILGANTLNIVWVIGASSLVTPLPIKHQTLVFDIPAMLLLTVLLLAFIAYTGRINRIAGGVLFTVYAAYIALTFFLFGSAP